MKQTLALTEYMRQYVEGTIDRKELEGLIFKYILRNHQLYKPRKWEWDDWVDYLSWIYPRVHRAIERYSVKGGSFDAYMTTLMRWSTKEYQSRQADHAIFEYSFWQASATDMMALSAEPDYAEAPVIRKTINNPRQMLMLILKCYYSVSDDFIRRAAPLAGVEAETLYRLVEKLRRMHLIHDQAKQGLRAHIACQYYRCISFENRMRAAPEGSSHKAEMEVRLEKAKERLARMRNRLKHMRKGASNSEIARILGIPKSTVDSSVYFLRWKWKTFKG
ncbi:MAG: hypothetical protein LBH73_05940 [Spirochaetaceae bacterium]|jgi:hypothetical protein|nr:hypothetical protein [Spirochaetaceae bacterium]